MILCPLNRLFFACCHSDRPNGVVCDVPLEPKRLVDVGNVFVLPAHGESDVGVDPLAKKETSWSGSSKQAVTGEAAAGEKPDKRRRQAAERQGSTRHGKSKISSYFKATNSSAFKDSDYAI